MPTEKEGLEPIRVNRHNISVGDQMFLQLDNFDYKKWLKEERERNEAHLKSAEIAFQKWEQEFK